MKLQLWAILILCYIGLSNCKDRTQIKTDLQTGVTESLIGDWIIEKIEIEFQDTYYQNEAGIVSDTILINFGEVEIEEWSFGEAILPSADTWNAMFNLHYEDQIYNFSFQGLLINTDEEEVVTQIFSINGNAGEHGDFLSNIGFRDNFKLIKEDEDKFVFNGLSRGIRKMVWIKK